MAREIQYDVFEPFVRGITQTGVRLANERAVLSLIGGVPGVSNADIARRTRLGPQTTARILSDLEERDLIIRGTVLRGRRGQPATPYTLNANGAFAISVEIGWRGAQVRLQNMIGQQLGEAVHVYDFPDPDTVFAPLAADIAHLLQRLEPHQRTRLAGIAVTTPGKFGPLLRHLGAPDRHIQAWADLDVASHLEALTGIETTWVNDGSAAAWKEMVMLPAPRPGSVLAVFVGTFVGGGVVSDGSVFEGPHGHGADLGAVIVSDRSGRPAYLHMLASLHALRRRLGSAGRPAPQGLALNWDWDGMGPALEQWLDDAGHALAQALLSAAAVIEVDLAVINGELPMPVLERLIERTRHYLADLPVLVVHAPRVIAGRGGPDATVSGAAQLLLFRQFFGRTWELFEQDED